MPAVQLTQLKPQIDDLLWKYTRPEEFLAGLHQLLEFYSFRVLRTGKGVQAMDLIPTYHTPPLVLHQLEIALGRQCAENPDAALPLAETLWQDPFLEVKEAAAFLLGQVPVDSPEVVIQHLMEWCQPEENKTVLKALLDKGGARMRQEKPDQWLELVSHWLNLLEIPWQSMALKALLPLLEYREFENLPPVFRMINPLVKVAKPELQADLLAVLNALAKQSPTETFFLLRQILTLGTTASAHRLIRRAIPAFPAAEAVRLRETLKDFAENSN